jgi:hypothetical protein
MLCCHSLGCSIHLFTVTPSELHVLFKLAELTELATDMNGLFSINNCFYSCSCLNGDRRSPVYVNPLI